MGAAQGHGEVVQSAAGTLWGQAADGEQDRAGGEIEGRACGGVAGEAAGGGEGDGEVYEEGVEDGM